MVDKFLKNMSWGIKLRQRTPINAICIPASHCCPITTPRPCPWPFAPTGDSYRMI